MPLLLILTGRMTLEDLKLQGSVMATLPELVAGEDGEDGLLMQMEAAEYERHACRMAELETPFKEWPVMLDSSGAVPAEYVLRGDSIDIFHAFRTLRDGRTCGRG